MLFGGKMKCGLLGALLAAFVLVQPFALSAQDRKAKQQVKPAYPELAKRLRIRGKVRIEVTIAPDGRVKNTKVTGGHPLLADAAQNAVKDWRYEPGPDETTQIVEFVFVDTNT